ncbi:FAD-linked oxidase C-terminal domain-containing protein [Sulfobacillus thermosulfidooxidans]|uniref:FAD-linked oxidase C-terminal domain-containing protein n=1 Tax=Sulfobacillus thermosulfidooxidans TaxID=28034 RepID=UPI00096BCFEA|nr:FAD-linked oxidase C-terminal domain-containing protein [Sulfobacillus thermosulfidooxidans]OLZ08762.1 glycolate oxidase subunit GlcD [Sulfobacillus thermosulfidooxidans]OLZ14818.1 glycolate oxidase subunit GlcD [Sulfobacillus thermosulfidooxidans]OLZ22038.1 glycolate oxidase subunit GlcD [Sulfobacillus thermosulfidooxidans]
MNRDLDWIEELKAVVGPEFVLTDPMALLPYACDGYTLSQETPRAVVLPQETEQVASIVRILRREGIPFLARGAGTSLSGGATPLNGAVILHLSRMNRIWEIDPENRVVVVDPGVVNAVISRVLESHGHFYAPDPSSQQACTIGGNFAENSGGPHCLKYGVTLNHIVMAEVVTVEGDVMRLGNLAGEPEGIDWLGLVIGSEGTLVIATKLWLRMTPKPAASQTVLALFDDVAEASQAVSDIVAAGVIPAALEMMDRLAIYAVERGPYPVGYPEDVDAVLLIEVDGERHEVEETARRVEAVLQAHKVRAVRLAESEVERNRWWANRKTAFGAMGLISPQYYVQDGVIPRSRLPEALARIDTIARHYNIRIANVFHAGDGNLHPLLLYDGKDAAMVERVRQAGSEILAVCVELGGSITGEHGVGIEKREDMIKQFGPGELAAQEAVKYAWDPAGLLNPGKLLPAAAVCHEAIPTPSTVTGGN